MKEIKKYIRYTFYALLFLAGPATGGTQAGSPAREAAAHTERARGLLDTANVRIGRQQWKQAISWLDSALFIMEHEGRDSELLYAQLLHQKGRSLLELGNYNEALAFFENALHLREAQLPGESLLLGDSYHALGFTYQNLGEYTLALHFHEKAYTIRQQGLPANSSQLARTLGHLGFCHIMAGNFLQATGFLNRAIEVQLARDGAQGPFTAWLNGKLGYAHYCLREYEKAVLHHEIALGTLSRENNGRDSLEQAWNMLILGNAHAGLLHYEKGLKYLQGALQYYRSKLGPEHPQAAQAINDMGYLYYNKKAYEKAIELHKSALEIRLKANDSYESIGQSYLNLGDCNFALANYRQALDFYGEAYNYRMLSLGRHHPFTIYCLMRQAGCQRRLRQYSQANYLLSRVFRYLNIDPEAKEETYVQHPILVLDALGERAVLFKEWYEEEQQQAALNSAMRAFRQLDDYAEYIQAFFEEQELAAVKSTYFEAAIQLCASLRKSQAAPSEQAFYFSERAKALFLHQNMQEANALAYAGIPNSLLSHEKALKKELTHFEKLRRGQLNGRPEEKDTASTAINARIASLRREYRQFKKQLESQYPDYYQLKYGLSTVSLSYVQDSLLQPGQTLLEYFAGDSSIFILLVQKGQYDIREIRRDFPLKEWIEQLREGICGYHNTAAGQRSDALRKELRKAYVEAAYELYQKLLAPVQDKLTEELILIPDGLLGYLPFEALLTERPSRDYRFNSHPYLLRKHQVTYCYSATLLREMRDKQHKQAPEKGFLAFAPYYGGAATTPASRPSPFRPKNAPDTLWYSGLEVLRLQQLLGGDAYLGSEATEARFTRLAGQYRLLHLSTHGRAESQAGDYSYLSFYELVDSLENERLYVKDLYNLQLNADMVTLSACETGIGELQRGEGIISLARAFAYAGAKSIITTLWKVDDRRSAQLMESFYRGLRNGLPKDAALRQAKLQLIRNSNSSREAHPYFWAGFIGIGDMSPLY